MNLDAWSWPPCPFILSLRTVTVIFLQTLARFFVVLPSMLHILDLAVASIRTIDTQSGLDLGFFWANWRRV